MSLYNNDTLLATVAKHKKLYTKSKLHKFCHSRKNHAFSIQYYQCEMEKRDNIIKQKNSQIALMNRIIDLMDEKNAITEVLITEKYAQLTEITAQITQLKSLLAEKEINLDRH